MNETDPLVGHVVDGRYEILRKLARGGMATVYLASDRRLTRTVAIKVMHENLGSDQDFVRRFDREARQAARLSHPNVVSVFDQGVDNGRPYMVMEYVEGQTLRHLITAQAPMEPLRALDLMIPITAAVAAAHDAGIIHRDLKPENVLLSTRGQLKVADFGLARAVTAHTATVQGMLLGSVSYIAPELVTNGPTDTRCDVYALGLVLYELLTGRKAHTGETQLQVAYSHVHNTISPPSASAPSQWRGTRSAIPAYLDDLVLTACAQNPADRMIDAGVLLDRLRRAKEAISNGILDDANLQTLMHQTGADPAEALTEAVPLVAPATAVQHTATLRFTPSTPLSPSHPGASDGMPYYDSPASQPSPPAKPPKPRGARKRRGGALALISLLLVTALVGVGAWYLLAGRFIATPDFVKLDQPEAVALAKDKGLVLDWQEEYSETIPKGQVSRSDPAARGRIAIGGTVVLYLSKGPERYPVPSLIGRTVPEATTELEAMNLKVGKTKEVFDETIPAGQVVSASIEAGKLVKRDTVVDLDVSKGPAPVKITSYVGKPFEDAQSFYEQAGLVVKRADDKFSDEVPVGSIVSQKPSKGTLAKGETITFTVSKGPELVTIPSVRGMRTDDAKAALKKAGVKVTVSQTFWTGFALGTDPGEGTQVPKGSTVTLYVG